MEKQLGWCSIEQSKKLIEAGLDLNTADMFISTLLNKEEYFVNNRKLQQRGTAPWLEDGTEIPCWSLGRLIELMPRENQNNTFEIAPSDVIENGYAVILHTEKYYMPFNEQTLIDAVVNAIVWLLENNYIKKEETK